MMTVVYTTKLYPIFDSIQEGKTVRDIKHDSREACATKLSANVFADSTERLTYRFVSGCMEVLPHKCKKAKECV